MSKLSFRARALDASKPMPVYLAEELPDLPDYSAINRAVPQMPSGMEKEEECEHHLQRAICTGLIIPTPEVLEVSDCVVHDRIYPPDYRMPRQLIHMQPLGLEQDVPDYDMDSEDEKWLKRQQAAAGARRCDLTELKFEETMERLERSSGQTVVTLREAKALSGRNGPAEHLLAAVYDYWLNKRLATQQPLLLAVRTEARPGAPSPYLAFRRRTEKMQTRKNRKNDESSYEKMVKLRRELSRAVSLLEMVRRRERHKKELIRLAANLMDKRYQARDFSGHMLAEAAASRVAVAPPILVPTYTAPHHHRPPVDPVARQREKRQYKRRKHRHHSSTAQPHPLHHGVVSGSSSSSEGEAAEAAPPPDPSGPFAFRRKPGCQYHMPTASFGPSVDVPWRNGCAKENTFPGDTDQRLRYTLTSLSHPTSRFIGLARRRLGRGGRVILDRLSSHASLDGLWAAMDYTITDSHPLDLDQDKLQTHRNTTINHTIDKNHSINNKELRLEQTTANSIVIKTEFDPDDVNNINNTNNFNSEKWNSDVRIKNDPCAVDRFAFGANGDKFTISDQIERIIKMEDMNSCNEDNGDFQNGEFIVGACSNRDDFDRIRNRGVSIDECRNSVSDEFGFRNRVSMSEDFSDYRSSEFGCMRSNLDEFGMSDRRSGGECLSIGDRRISVDEFGNKVIRSGGGLRIQGEAKRKMTDMLVRRGLKRFAMMPGHKTAAEVDEIFTDCVHFRPQSPPPSPKVSTPMDGETRLTDGAPIMVQVLPPLPPLAPLPLSDLPFNDTSLFTTSEFTLSDLYGDSLLPDPRLDIDIGISPINSWRNTNGPSDKLFDNASNSDSPVLTSKSSDSNSNHTSVFTPSTGTPNSLHSCNDDSNHAISGTNGVEWNDSNSNEKQLLKMDDFKVEKRMGSSVFTLKNVMNEKRIFVTAEKQQMFRAVTPPPLNVTSQSPQQGGIYIPISSSQQIKKRPEGQGLAVVQVRAPNVVRQVIGRVGGDGLSRPPLLVAQHVKAVAGGHKAVAGTHKAVAPTHKTLGHNAVTKAVQQQIGRKLQHDAARRIGNEEQMTVNAGTAANQQLSQQQPQQQQQQQQQQGGQQQLVTVAVTESLKLRLQGHLLGQRDGLVQAGRRAVVNLHPTTPNAGAAAPPAAAGTPLGPHHHQGRQVKVVRTLTAAQRNRLLQAAGTGALGLRELAGMLHLGQSHSDPKDARTVHLNDTPPANPSITNAVVVSAQQPNNVAGPTPGAPANATPAVQQQSGASQQRKGPMEVT